MNNSRQSIQSQDRPKIGPGRTQRAKTLQLVIFFGAAFLAVMKPCISEAAPHELVTTITEVAPGVYRVRAGEPELIVPSLVKAPSKNGALAAMSRIQKIPIGPITVWRMNRGCRVELPLASSEMIYGLGLQCKHLAQNGWRRTLFTMAGDNNGKGMSHAPAPFYVSTHGYGVLVDSARFLTFSVGEEQRLENLRHLEPSEGKRRLSTNLQELYAPEQRNQSSVYVDIPAAKGVDIYVFGGPTLGDAVARYNLFSGGGCLPPLASLGPEYLLGTMLESESALSLCDGFKNDLIPITSVGLEPCWQTHAYSSTYVWNRQKFPEGFIQAVRAEGYALTLWCQLYLDPASPLISRLGGNFGDFEVWHGLVPDMANPGVRDRYGNFLLKNFIQEGISGFKLDEVDGSWDMGAFGEWMFPEFTAFPSGAEGDQARNLLGRSGIQAMHEAYRKANRRTFGLVRASQGFAAPLPFALYSDEYNFADYLRYNLSAGVQGFLWSPEVRDSEGEEDWARRVAAAAFSAKMTFNDWQFPHPAWKQPRLSANERGQLLPDDNPYIRIARRFTHLRMSLLPYLYQAYGDYYRQGISPVRPLVTEWPLDPRTWNIDDEWMLGADVLAAPLTDENAFSELHRVELSEESTLKADPGVQMKFEKGILSLDIAGVDDGLPGASMELDLNAGPCVARLSARGDVRQMALRLRRVENGTETEVGDMYKDDIPLDGRNWKELEYQFKISAQGHYRLLVSKGYFQRLPEPRHLEVSHLSFEQRTGNPRQSWRRLVYLPAGVWRDFWTGAEMKGGQRLAVTATPDRPPIFVRNNTLLPLAEPVATFDRNTSFRIHLAAYGNAPQFCRLLEDDGETFDFESGKCATLTVHPDGAVDRPSHGQPQRYQIIGRAEPPDSVLGVVLSKTESALAGAIQPADIWPDDRGQHVQAHGAGILQLGDTYYMFGEDRSRSNLPEKRYISCYSSKDLIHWRFRRQVVHLAAPEERLGGGWVLERPKVFFNAATRKFIMYAHLDDESYALARVALFVCDKVDGDYQYISSFRPLGNESRDLGQFVDDDGAAYLLSEDRANGFHIYKLSNDYLSPANDVCLIRQPLEGLAAVHYNGRYFLVGSHLTSWAPNPNVYMTAKSLAGPWSDPASIAPAEFNTYGSQSSFLFRVTGTESTTVIFMADIWKPETQWDSRYLWMPLQIGDGQLWLAKPCCWTIDVHTGQATLGGQKQTFPKLN